jgi:hypothetical protein
MLEEIDWSQLGIGFVLGYVISWGYFFITLPLFIGWFGKLNGPLINYGMSWIIWFVATFAIHQAIPDDIPINF